MAKGAKNPGEFAKIVYFLLASVPRGKVTTYQSLARASGHPKAARAVGTLMRRNSHPDTIPCYKVVRSDGSVGEYSGKGGVNGKIRRLLSDGIPVRNGRVNNLGEFLHDF